MNHQRLQKFAHSKQFIHLVNYAIISFAVLVGAETVLTASGWQNAFQVADYLYLGFFTVEIIIRILAEDHPGMYFALFRLEKVNVNGKTKTKFIFTEHGFWNYFDFTLIFLSILGLSAQLYHPTFFEIGRMFRIFRIVRLLEISDHLKEVEQRIMSILPTVFSFMLLLLILNYIYAILGMYMYDSGKFATCDFSSVVDSLVTLFQVMTLDNWSDVMKDLAANTRFHPFIIQMYFITFVMLTSIIAFNVFIAVMTSQVADKVETDLARRKGLVAQPEVSNGQLSEGMREIMAELRQLKQEVGELRRGG
jgi:voltage-gated sodium channel